MNDSEILAAFHARRSHYDAYLEANDIAVCTCPGCGFPSLEERNMLAICDVCQWEDDGQDDEAEGIPGALHVSGVTIPTPNGGLSLRENRINIGRVLEINAGMIDGQTDLDVARVLRTIAFYRHRRKEVDTKITGDEHPQDHIWMERLEIKKDLQMALVVT